MNYKIVVFITPLKQYAKQNIDRFNNYEIERKTILIDSDGSRDINIINEFIKHDKILLSVTYKSCDIICEIIDKLDDVLIVFDEFHNFSHNNIYDENNSIYKLINNDNHKKLYLSATPRIYELENNDDIDVNEIFGEYIYKMSFNEAITNKYISDYEIYLPIFGNEDKNLEYIGNIHEDYLLKLQFLIEAIKISSNLKIIVYVRTHQEIEEFIENFNKINEYYAYDVLINKMTCDNSYKQRNKILDEFNKSDKISILLSVHILDEAIDIPTCNAIYMTYISSSKIKNVQRMSRAMRYSNHKVANIFIFCKDIDDSLDYFSSIKEYDVDFLKKINYLKILDKIIDKKERSELNEELNKKNKIKIFGIKLYRCETWCDNFNKVKLYIDENNKKPSTIDIDTTIKKLGRWIGRQQYNYSNNKCMMKDEKIYNMWTEIINDNKYKKYLIFNNTIPWIEIFNKVKIYINDNNKRPSTKDTDNNIKKLGTWIQSQQKLYNNKKYSMSDISIYNMWTEFINNNKELFGIYSKLSNKSIKAIKDINIKDKNNNNLWIKKLDTVKQFIYENNDEYNGIKIYSIWIRTQHLLFLKKEKIMDDEYIYNIWMEFINDNKYKEYIEQSMIPTFFDDLSFINKDINNDRYTHFFFVIFNYTKLHIKYLSNFLSKKCKFLIFGKVIDLEFKSITRHLKGYITFEDAKSILACIKLLNGTVNKKLIKLYNVTSRADVMPCLFEFKDDVINYCKKNSDYYQYGIKCKDTKENLIGVKYSMLITDIKLGIDLKTLTEKYTLLYIKNSNSFEKLYNLHSPNNIL